MKSDQLRMVMFVIVAVFCVIYMFTTSGQYQKELTEYKKKELAYQQKHGLKKSNEEVVQKGVQPQTNNQESNTSSKESSSNTVPEAEIKPASTVDKPAEEQKKTYAIANTVADAKKTKVETEHLILEFDSLGASLEKISFKNYRQTYVKDSGHYVFMQPGTQSTNVNTFVVQGLDPAFSKTAYVIDEKEIPEGKSLVFQCVVDGVEVQKSFLIPKAGYDFQFEVKVINHREEEYHGNLQLVGASNLDFDFKDINSYYSNQIATLINDNGSMTAAGDVHFWSGTYGARQGLESLNEEPFVMGPGRKTENGKHDQAKVVWGALKNRYFSIILKPASDQWTVKGINQLAHLKEAKKCNPLMTFEKSIGNLVPKQSFSEKFKVYVGPMKTAIIKDDKYTDDHFFEVIDYGFMFPPFIKVLDGILNFIIKIIGPSQYWLGIILLTLLVRLSMYPITRKSSMSQAKLQKVAPKMKELKEKYKNDQRRFQQELMKLYREEGVNPLSSCLPMFIQMPIFIGLYWTFNLTFEVRFKSFLWIDDLAVSDRLFGLGFEIPLVGSYFNLLPILYAVINYLHMSSMPAPADEMQQQQQKIMKYMFPVMMLLFFYNMPSALVLYFIVSGTWSIVEQKSIRKRVEAIKAAG